MKKPSTMVSTDRDVLLDLYRSTGGPYWKRKDNWDTDARLSNWHGVGVNDEGRVIDISLPNNNLHGTMTTALGELTALETLYLRDNHLSGSIPKELGALGKLKLLWLSINNLTGHIPKELGDLSRLERLRLGGNQLDGPIPPELGKLAALEYLYLDENRLSGAIPKELGNLTALTELWLHENSLTGGIPASLGQLDKLQKLFLNHNRLNGPIPKDLGYLRALTHVALFDNELTAPSKQYLTGGRLKRWQETLTGARRQEPWVISFVDFLIDLWHFLIPIFDDVTDVILLLAKFKDRGSLWWACCGALALADVERVFLVLVTLLLVLCWIPFALLGTDESRGQRFGPVFRVVNGGHDLILEPVFVRNDFDRGVAVWGNRPSALRWPILDGITWAVVGSRSKSSSLMIFCGMAGNTPVDQFEQSGFGLSLIDRIVHHHPYSALGRALFSCPHGHHLPPSDTATRRSGVMLRAVGETLVVDSLFLALSLSSETFEDGVSIGIVSLIFSLLELVTELQYYLAEARKGMVADREEAMELVVRAPPV